MNNFLTDSAFKVANVPLQVGPTGFSITSAAPMIEDLPWKSRRTSLMTRRDGDVQLKEIVTFNGKRHVLGLAANDNFLLANNDISIQASTKAYLRGSVLVQGEAASLSHFSSLQAAYLQAQITWAHLTQLRAYLATPDLPESILHSLDAEYDSLRAALPTVNVVSPVWSGSATFKQGASCIFSTNGGNYLTSFSLELLFEEEI